MHPHNCETHFLPIITAGLKLVSSAGLQLNGSASTAINSSRQSALSNARHLDAQECSPFML